MKRTFPFFFVFGQFILCKLEGWTSSSRLINMPCTELNAAGVGTCRLLYLRH